MNDTTAFTIYNLSFRESGGFNVRKMNSDFALANSNISFTSAFISCDSSILNIPYMELRSDSTGSFSNFTENAHLDIRLDNSHIFTSDLRYFVPGVETMSIFPTGMNQRSVAISICQACLILVTHLSTWGSISWQPLLQISRN
jgi:hypothetical protein